MGKACCYKISASIAADSPVHIGNGKRTGIIKHSLPFLPGSVIRGAIGSCLMKLDGEKAAELYDMLFAEEAGKTSDIFFRHCYPSHLKCGRGKFIPSPKTLFKCQNRQCGKIYNTFEPPLQCDNCGKSVKPASGFVCNGCGEINPLPVSMTRLSGTDIDRENYSAALITAAGTSNGSGTSEYQGIERVAGQDRHGLLHTLEVIERGSKFSLELILHSNYYHIIDRLTAILQRGLEDEGIGGSKSRGFGSVKVTDTKVQEITANIIEKEAGKIGNRFSVNFVSPVIVEDNSKSLEPVTLLEGARRAYSWCFKEGKPALPDLKRINKIYSYDVFGGWSLKQERKRRASVSISSGSAFLFEASGSANGEDIFLLSKALASLEYYAIGGYKPHGYGQVSIMT
jgi:CRISPR/Cas system CSM-associated protein Csm3 (group 7 of RAMP superfamily)